jgi:two-component system chemotaxis sensor kinase CheA
MVSDDFLKEYVVEVKEHLQELESSLLYVEREGADKEEINKIFRAAHSIKGASAYMGYEKLAHLTHEMESLFGKIQNQALPVTPRGISILLECVDFVSGALKYLQEQGEEPPLPEPLLAKLTTLFDPGGWEEKEPEEKLSPDEGLLDLHSLDLPTPTSRAALQGVEAADFSTPLSGERGQEELKETEEEDQELLGIFLTSLDENITELRDLFVANAQNALSRSDLDHAHELLGKLVNSSQYMDYQSVARQFKEWESDFAEEAKSNPQATGSFYAGQLDAYARRIEGVFPQFQAPEPSMVPEAPQIVQDEDEELLTIFVDSFQQRFTELSGLTPSLREATLREKDADYAREIIQRLISSSQYMDYDPVVEVLKEWEGALAGLEAIDGRGYSRLLNSYGSRLQEMMPMLELHVELEPASQAQSADAPPDEEDEELLGIFLEAFREQHAQLVELAPSQPEAVLTDDRMERFRECINRMISSSQYMGYEETANHLMDWERALADAHESGQSTGARYSELLKDLTGRLEAAFPKLGLAAAMARPEGPTAESGEGQFDKLQEEDEELLSIFLESFRDHLTQLRQLTPATPKLALAEAELLSARGLIRRLISSSQYMGYDEVVNVLEEAEKELLDSYEGDRCDGASFTELLDRYSEGLRKKLPGLEVPISVQQAEEPYFGDIDREIDASFDMFEQLAPDAVGSALVPDADLRKGDEEPVETPQVEATAKDVPTSPPKESKRKPSKKGRVSAVSEEAVSSSTLRVDAQKVDDVLNQVGELVVTRSEFIQTAAVFRDILRELAAQGRLSKSELRKLRSLGLRLNESTQSLGRVASQLQDSAMRIRMLPVAQLFQRFPRVVRDQALKLGKQVELLVEGGDTEIDKRVLEQMHDPIVQFLRNAIAHGIESPEERKRAGKPEIGVIRLAAYHEGDHVVLEIEDDGGGIDLLKLRQILRARKEMSAQELERIGDQELAYAIFLPGISTRMRVDGAAGRGVGLDVVKENVDRMNGTIEVDSRPGQGTRFVIRIPLTLAIIRALLVRGADQVFTIPLSSVSEILRFESGETHNIEGFQVINLRGSTVPLVHLNQLLSLSGGVSADGRGFIVIVNTRFREVGLVVDGLMGEREVVIKSMEDDYHAFDGFSGATVLGDGSISLILDVSSILKKVKNTLPMQEAYPYSHEAYLH